jgi:uncharacterized coiled-coil DUF342 family protein
MCEEHQAAGAVDPVGELAKMTTDHARDVFDDVIAERDALQQQVATLVQERDGAWGELGFTKNDLGNALHRAQKAEQQVATLRDARCGTCHRALPADGDCYGCTYDRMVEQCAKTVDFHRDMAERFAEDRDALKHKAREAEARVATLTEALVRWVRQFDGQTEPVPPVYWQIELDESKRVLASLAAVRGER